MGNKNNRRTKDKLIATFVCLALFILYHFECVLLGIDANNIFLLVIVFVVLASLWRWLAGGGIDILTNRKQIDKDATLGLKKRDSKVSIASMKVKSKDLTSNITSLNATEIRDDEYFVRYYNLNTMANLLSMIRFTGENESLHDVEVMSVKTIAITSIFNSFPDDKIINFLSMMGDEIYEHGLFESPISIRNFISKAIRVFVKNESIEKAPDYFMSDCINLVFCHLVKLSLKH